MASKKAKDILNAITKAGDLVKRYGGYIPVLDNFEEVLPSLYEHSYDTLVSYTTEMNYKGIAGKENLEIVTNFFANSAMKLKNKKGILGGSSKYYIGGAVIEVGNEAFPIMVFSVDDGKRLIAMGTAAMGIKSDGKMVAYMLGSYTSYRNDINKMYKIIFS